MFLMLLVTIIQAQTAVRILLLTASAVFLFFLARIINFPTFPVNLKQSLEVSIPLVHSEYSTGVYGYVMENVKVVYKPVSAIKKLRV